MLKDHIGGIRTYTGTFKSKLETKANLIREMTIIKIPETPRLLVPIAQGKVSKLLPTIACHILKIVPADEELIFL